MQIYSPKRDTYLQEQSSTERPTLPLHFHNMDQDKENMVPMEAIQPFKTMDQEPEALKYLRNNDEPQASVDSRMFLQSLLGGGSKKAEETEHGIEEMEETACIDGIVQEIDKSNRTRNSDAFTVGQNADVTRYFNSEDVTVGVEETKCYGGIVNEDVSIGHTIEANKENFVHSANQTVHMEDTKPIGGILKGGSINTTLQAGLKMKHGYDSGINVDNNVTRCFKMEEGADDGIEETKCVGGILSKADKCENNFVESQVGKTRIGSLSKSPAQEVRTQMEVDIQGDANARSHKSDDTVYFNVQDNMEETRAIGGIIDKTETVISNEQLTGSNSDVKMDTGNQTVAMEETVALGKILDTTKKDGQGQFVNKSIALSEQLIDSVSAMEETKPVGGILKDNQTFSKTLNICGKQEDMEITKNITVPMEETKTVGGFLNKSKVEMMITPNVENIVSNKTVNITVDMEETKALDGLLDKSVSKTAVQNNSEIDFIDKTIDYTVGIEETEAVGRILEKNNSDQITFCQKGKSFSNKTLNQTVSLEETKTVGGILNKTPDQTIYFDDVKTDWFAKDLKLESNGKAADGTSFEALNKTAAIEETKCVGGILTSDMEMMKGKFENMYNHANDEVKSNKTVVEPVPMEETKCVTESIYKEINQKNTGAEFRTYKMCDLQSQSGFSVERETESKMCIENNFSIERGMTEVENGTSHDIVVESNINDVEIDDEITFKVSNKRNFDECRGETSGKNEQQTIEKNEEKTKDFTQTNLAKLKEMLILSKRKTAAHLRQGDIRTPSKLSPLFPGLAPECSSKPSCSSKLNLEETRSPLQKRQRLSEAGPGVDGETDDFGADEKTDATAALLMGFEDDGFTTSLLESCKMENTDIQGIEDEQMPDTLHHDLLTSNSTNETHSDKNSTVHSEPVSTTVQETNETHSSGNDTRNSSSVNLSMFSNKSFALSFVVPEGPLSLESFFKLTFPLTSKIQGTRCSTIFAPRIDLDDLTEVLHAELTLNPLVKAKKKMKAHFTQQIQKSEASMEWLEKSLEETQPEIFQDCAKASSEELEKITGELRSLRVACHTEVEIAWKQGTKEMFSEALHDIQNDGVRRAEEMLHKVKEDSQTLDDLLTSIDDDLCTLEKNDQMLEELQGKEEKLSRDMEKLSGLLQEKSVEESELCLMAERQSQKDTTDEMKNLLKQEIVSHLICCEWNLDELEEDLAVFTFLDDKIELHVDFILGTEEKQISDITLRLKSTTDCRFFEDRVAVAFVLNGVKTESLKQKFTTFSSLPKLLHEVSVSINEIRMFCKDLEDVHLYHILKFENNSICTELWDRDTMDFIKVSFIFKPGHPLTKPVDTTVTVKVGKLKSCHIEKKLREVTPGPRYLSRLIKSVNFKQLNDDTICES